jgi:hypothetical protein
LIVDHPDPLCCCCFVASCRLFLSIFIHATVRPTIHK